MTDDAVAERIIRFYIQHKYYAIKDKRIARGYAIEDLTQLKFQYGFKIMRRAGLHTACTGITKFKKLCQQFKEISDKKP